MSVRTAVVDYKDGFGGYEAARRHGVKDRAVYDTADYKNCTKHYYNKAGTTDTRQEIKDKYNAGGYTYKSLAKEYGLAASTIRRYINFDINHNPKYVKLTDDEKVRIKQLLNKKVSVHEICNIFNIGESTVYKVSKSK